MSKKKKKAHEQKDYIANPKELDGVPDLSMLVYLEMAHVLFNCEFRYCNMARKHCYTSVSTILIAINPYERLPIYGQDVINEFHEAMKKGRLPHGRPHPYGVSARSYMRMIQRKCNQSVIVCGESGAGKTETTKLLMRYLAMTAPSASMESSIVEQQIIAASPILEAYGNAKTVLNNNSSRFGKFTKLLYDVPDKAREGHILGSYLETYLLEKSRVAFQANNERNYHIPYFLYAGIPKDQHDKFGILHGKEYHYTRQGGAVEVPGISDIKRYEELIESLKLMRIDETIQVDLWMVTMGIFNLGNVNYKRQDDGFASIDPKSDKFVTKLAEVWGVEKSAVVARLTTGSMKVMKKIIVKKIQFDDATTNRDSISKGIYENIFLYLGERINAELYQTDESDIESILFIGILDVFGFENFYINSMEQFCINFTNEKLQQYFNYHIIRSEQEEYIKESVFWKPLTIPDNMEYINFVQGKVDGFFTLLDSTCKAPQPTVEAFMQILFKKQGKRECLSIAKGPGAGNARGGPKKKSKKKGKSRAKFDGFMVKHFADDVAYDCSKFLIKNMEAVHPDTAKMLKKSKMVLIREIGSSGPKGRKKKSVTAVFHGGIKTLMKNLQATEPYFVRCLNPNIQKSSTIWTEGVVEHQLRCGGLVEALKVLKLGYPTRVPYSTLYDRYHGNVTNPLIKNMGPEAFSTALLIAFDVSENDYELGLTKIFFKPAKAAVLDTIMSQAGKPLSAEQNKKITKWVVQKRIKQMVGTCRSFLELRKRVRLKRAEKRWAYAGRIASILGGTVVRHLYIARESILKRKREEASLMMQSFFRGTYERSRYLKRIDKIHKATKIIWISYRRWQDRIELQKWLDIKVEATRKRKEEERKKQLELERQRKLEEARRLAAMKEEEKKKELERIRAEKAAEADKRRQEKLEIERKRLEEEKRKAEEEERIRAEAKKKAEEEAARKLEEERKKLELEKEEARKRLEQKSMTINKEKKDKEREEHETARKKREASIKMNRSRRKKKEERRKDKRAEDYIKKNFNEMLDDSDDEDDYTDDSDDDSSSEPIQSMKEQLKNFAKIAATGQLFLKYTGKRRRKPQDRIVKVSFDNNYKPKQISWGSGSRHIDFSEILYIAWGHWTPVFQSRKDQLESKLCFSVVGKQQILDVQAQSKDMAELWVKGLRKLIGQTDEKAEKLSKQSLESGNLPGFNKTKDVSEAKKIEREHKKRTKSLMLLQQDLFVMTTTTVFRNLEEERIWDIDQSVRERFNAKTLYELALREDIPWRQWNHWVREKIVTYLRENNRIATNMTSHQQAQQGGFGGGGGGAFGTGGGGGGGYQQPMQGGYGGGGGYQQGYGQQLNAPQQQGGYGGYQQQVPQVQQGYGQQNYQQQAPPQMMTQPIQQMNTNWNVQGQIPKFGAAQQGQQAPPNNNQTQQGGGGGGKKGQGGQEGECSLM